MRRFCTHLNNSCKETCGKPEQKALAMSYESKFKGKSAIVTGAGRGIGREIAAKLGALGVTVYAVARSPGTLSTLETECPNVKAVAVDLGNWESTRAAIEKIPAVDYLVNNAGISITANFLDTKQQDIDAIYEVNLKAVINVSQVVAKKMIAAGKSGSIVNVSSVGGLRAFPSVCAYSTLKAALDHLTKCMAIELGPQKIRVNAINPGPVMTDMFKAFQAETSSSTDDGVVAAVNARIPSVQKVNQLEEVVATVVFVLSDAAPMIVGSSITLDGDQKSIAMAYESNFKGKSAIVTGAGRGIGRAIVSKLHAIGANVFAVARNPANLSSLETECPGIRTIAVDLGNWKATREAMEGLPAVDYLVNNAGILSAANFLDVTQQDFDSIYEVNLKAVVNVSQVVAKKMIAAGKSGSIVNVSSVCGLKGFPSVCAYSTLKASLDQLTRIMAIELAPLKIRVNGVNPGAVMTDMFKEFQQGTSTDEVVVAAGIARIPSPQKINKVEEVTATVLFLLSDAAPMIVGSSIALDGGFCVG
ncbi:unnamed protein product [Allacma fusca]|uniref:L-xylulose reductase n=1 Tax=Allacma fusca TaxID=39272 RepID=A0A8J2PBC6_9HEXA|nr:unnamed protein product [Allacma fusca]